MRPTLGRGAPHSLAAALTINVLPRRRAAATVSLTTATRLSVDPQTNMRHTSVPDVRDYDRCTKARTLIFRWRAGGQV